MLVEYEFIGNIIHIKIGGDHGGDSFKMSFQICNVSNPNSKNNTVVFSIFEARFKEQVDELQTMEWEWVNKKIFKFLLFHNFPFWVNCVSPFPLAIQLSIFCGFNK